MKQSRVGVVGYCRGGGFAISALGRFPDRVVVAASFHGASLATDKSDSPHRLASEMRGKLYVGVAGIDPGTVKIDRHRGVAEWEAFVRRVFIELSRVTRPHGIVAFEVGEVRGGKTILERHVVTAIAGLPFEVAGVMVNRQSFTKTANCWGVGNNKGGTNSNRIVLARRL